RHLLKKRGYSFLNIAGLAIGIACASMIFLWVEDEWTFNHNFPRHSRLYQVYDNQKYEGKMGTFVVTPGPMAAGLRADIPGIGNAARSSGTGPQVFALGDKTVSMDGDYVDPPFVTMLDLPFVYGRGAGALSEVHSIVIDQTMAGAFFGAGVDPVGRTLRVNGEQDLVVTGVFRDLPQNCTFRWHWLAPMDNIIHMAPWMGYWGAMWARTYVELKPNASLARVNEQLKGYLGTKQKGNTTPAFLLAMDDWNLRSKFVDGKQAGGRIEYVRLFSIIAVIILLIACINFMNLSTARSERRAREVGVRKVMGAGRGSLVAQFIGEAMVMSFAAVLLAVVLVSLLLPSFNLLVQKQLRVDVLAPAHLGYLLVMGLAAGLVAGSYPAFFLSSFDPVAVLKDLRIPGSVASVFVRRGLVVAQFVASIVLIIGTVVVYRQIQYVRARDLGYSKDRLVYTDFSKKQAEHFDRLRNELLRTGVVADASISDYRATEIGYSTDKYSWQGKDASKNPLINWEGVDEHFLPTMNMQLVQGRNFYGAVDSDKVIVNEAMAAAMGSAGRVGSIILNGEKKPLEVVGIVKNFVYNSIYDAAAPAVLYNRPYQTRILSIRLRAEAPLGGAVADVEGVLKANNPGYTADIKFVDADFEAMYRTEALTGKLAGLFAALAVVISCLGLFGLAAYTAERRLKELGIRKVLGASVPGLVGLLSGQFVKLVGVACLVAWPVAWWVMSNWLNGFAYHTKLYWWIFFVAGVGAMVIALVTVSVQAVRAAVASPVESLRSE
ncbi:MAG: ABC transporter permease, partial [Bacteroidetes bacterium]|nr:ABC transporter permease [Bacteroidota bacterium]